MGPIPIKTRNRELKKRSKNFKKNSPGNRKINTLVPQRLVCFKCHVARDRIIYDIKQLVADNCVTGHSLSIAETFKS